jgi:hypothetical protein
MNLREMFRRPVRPSTEGLQAGTAKYSKTANREIPPRRDKQGRFIKTGAPGEGDKHKAR